MHTRLVLVVDRDGVVSAANDAARARLGACVGRRCADVVDLRCTRETSHCAGGCAAEIAGGQHEQRGRVRGAPARVYCTGAGDSVVVVITPEPVVAVDVEELTPRERQVLTLVADGLTGWQIAERLGVGRATVRTHVEHAREKLRCRSRAEAVARAMSLGWLGEAG